MWDQEYTYTGKQEGEESIGFSITTCAFACMPGKKLAKVDASSLYM